MNTTKYGKLVRKARLDNDITMLEMARSIGVLPSLLCATETGETQVSADLLEKVEKFFGSRGIVVKGLREAAQKPTNP
jgi:transcriptional regulator with XRE-family HTH domain